MQSAMVVDIGNHKMTHKQANCDACAIIIAPGYIETESHKVGNKAICTTCKNQLEKFGFLQLTENTRLMADGKVVGRYIWDGLNRRPNPAYSVKAKPKEDNGNRTN